MTNLILLISIILDLIPGGDTLSTKLNEKVVPAPKTEKTIEQPLVLPIFQPLPYKNNNYVPLETSAKGLLITDIGTGEVLGDKDKTSKLNIASLTKLMTAKLLLEDGKLSDAVTIRPEDIQAVRQGDSVVGLAPEEEITYEGLLKCLLISSGSDCALTIANNLYPGGYDEFIKKMNTESKEMALNETQFTNPVGWDDEGNFSTAKDISTLTRVLLKNETFKKITATKSETVYTIKGRPLALSSTNLLLDNQFFRGVKTGFTNGAGECLVSLTTARGHDVLITLIGSEDRFSETKSILNWVNLVYNW